MLIENEIDVTTYYFIPTNKNGYGLIVGVHYSCAS
jgi:hypothetical protein